MTFGTFLEILFNFVLPSLLSFLYFVLRWSGSQVPSLRVHITSFSTMCLRSVGHPCLWWGCNRDRGVQPNPYRQNPYCPYFSYPLMALLWPPRLPACPVGSSLLSALVSRQVAGGRDTVCRSTVRCRWPLACTVRPILLILVGMSVQATAVSVEHPRSELRNALESLPYPSPPIGTQGARMGPWIHGATSTMAHAFPFSCLAFLHSSPALSNASIPKPISESTSILYTLVFVQLALGMTSDKFCKWLFHVHDHVISLASTPGAVHKSIKIFLSSISPLVSILRFRQLLNSGRRNFKRGNYLMAALEPEQQYTIKSTLRPCKSDKALDFLRCLLLTQLDIVLGHGASFGVYAVIGAQHPYIGQTMQTRTSGHNSHMPGMSVRYFEHILAIHRLNGHRSAKGGVAKAKIPCKERYTLLASGGNRQISLFAITVRPDRQANLNAEAARIQLAQPLPNFVRPAQAVFAISGHLVTKKKDLKDDCDFGCRRKRLAKHFRLHARLQRVRSDDPPPDLSLWTFISRRLEARHGSKRRHLELIAHIRCILKRPLAACRTLFGYRASHGVFPPGAVSLNREMTEYYSQVVSWLAPGFLWYFLKVLGTDTPLAKTVDWETFLKLRRSSSDYLFWVYELCRILPHPAEVARARQAVSLALTRFGLPVPQSYVLRVAAPPLRPLVSTWARSVLGHIGVTQPYRAASLRSRTFIVDAVKPTWRRQLFNAPSSLRSVRLAADDLNKNVVDSALRGDDLFCTAVSSRVPFELPIKEIDAELRSECKAWILRCGLTPGVVPSPPRDGVWQILAHDRLLRDGKKHSKPGVDHARDALFGTALDKVKSVGSTKKKIKFSQLLIAWLPQVVLQILRALVSARSVPFLPLPLPGIVAWDTAHTNTPNRSSIALAKTRTHLCFGLNRRLLLSFAFPISQFIHAGVGTSCARPWQRSLPITVPFWTSCCHPPSAPASLR